MSIKCDFGTSLETELMYQVIQGVSREQVRQRLLTEPTLTFTTAVQLI